jgi:hypothetical protein
MSKVQYFNLQPSETAIFQAAANIYAGYVQSGQVTSENSTEIMKKAIGASISIARTVEKIVQSDEEMLT